MILIELIIYGMSAKLIVLWPYIELIEYLPLSA